MLLIEKKNGTVSIKQKTKSKTSNVDANKEAAKSTAENQTKNNLMQEPRYGRSQKND
jgi:hypothetical protein